MKQLVVVDANGDVAEASIEDIIATEKNKFKGWICETGLQGLYIDFDGHVWIGNCAGGQGKYRIRENPESSPWGYLGHINREIKIPKSKVICPLNGCGCGSDVVVTKYKPENEKVINLIKNTDQLDWGITKNFSDMGELSAVKMRHLGPKQILWDISRRCNYDCSYCWPDVHNTTDPHRSLSEFVKTADYLIDNWSEGHQIRWYFGGGEPTLNPDFEPFIDYLAQKNQWTMLVTNASQGPSYWAKNADNYKVLLFSAHFEFMKPELFKKNVARVAEVLANGSKRLEKFIVKLMTPAGKVNHSIEFTESIKASIPNVESLKDKIQFDMVPIRGSDGYDRTNYNENELQKIIWFNKVNQ